MERSQEGLGILESMAIIFIKMIDSGLFNKTSLFSISEYDEAGNLETDDIRAEENSYG